MFTAVDKQNSKRAKLVYTGSADYAKEQSPPPGSNEHDEETLETFLATLTSDAKDDFNATTRIKAKRIRYNKKGDRRKPYNMTNRKNVHVPVEKMPKKQSTLTDPDKIRARFKEGCCEKECIWSHFDVSTMTIIRTRYSLKSEKGRTMWLRQLAASVYKQDPS